MICCSSVRYDLKHKAKHLIHLNLFLGMISLSMVPIIDKIVQHHSGEHIPLKLPFKNNNSVQKVSLFVNVTKLPIFRMVMPTFISDIFPNLYSQICTPKFVLPNLYVFS